MSIITVSALHVYPIKSCRGHAVDRALVTARGLEDDRLFMLTDADGHFLSQREYPRMALIAPTVGEALLTLRAPGMAAVDLPMRTGGPTNQAIVWRDTCQVIDQGEAAAQWLGDYLGAHVRLVRISDEFPRPVDPDYQRTAADQTSFSDGFPFLLISEESLADLNSRLEVPLPMNRFRPNIVVRGGGPFAEDEWQQIRIGTVLFDLVKPCARCQITTIDQATGTVAGKEPLATFATFRRTVMSSMAGSSIDEGKVMFGQNMLSTGSGMIAIGDSVRVEN